MVTRCSQLFLMSRFRVFLKKSGNQIRKNHQTGSVMNLATMNVMCQPQVSAIQGMSIGAMIGPTLEPELNKLVAKVRSFLGNQSATVLIDDGKLPASLIPKQ